MKVNLPPMNLNLPSNLPLLPRYQLIFASIALQIISFIFSVTTAGISAKDLKFDAGDLRACFLYMKGEIDPGTQTWNPTTYDSYSCSAIQAISGIDALSSVLMIITLVWLQFFGLERSKNVSWILIGVGIFSSFIALIASCMYLSGIIHTKSKEEDYYMGILAAGTTSLTVQVGLFSSWIAFFTWILYLAVELVGYNYYDKRFF